MIELAESSRPIDEITLVEEWSDTKELVTVGDVSYVASLVDAFPTAPALSTTSTSCARKPRCESWFIPATRDIGAISGGAFSQECIGDLSERLLQVRTGLAHAPAERVLKFSDAVFNEWERIANNPDDVVGLTTGIDSVDHVTTGIRPGETWAVGGRTGDGKTSLASQIAAANCRRGIAVGYFSIEMSKGELLQRLWSHEGRSHSSTYAILAVLAPTCELRCGVPWRLWARGHSLLRRTARCRSRN